jgi:hypothetical protein
MKKIMKNTSSFSPLVKKTLFFLALGIVSGSGSLFAKEYSSIAKNDIKAAEYSLEQASPLRVVTQDEFNGVAPILLGINEQLIIPITYQGTLDNNQHSLSCHVADNNIIATQLFDAGTALALFKVAGLFKGTAVGETSIEFMYDTTMVKELAIKVVDPGSSAQ